jgi:hypothetical protein
MNRTPRSTVIPLLLIAGFLSVCCVIFQYDAIAQWFVDRIDEPLRRESRQRFRDTIADVSAVTDDTVVSESQREIHTSELCFFAEAQQVFSTNRSFDAVLAEYSADLPDIDFNSSDCKRFFRGPEGSALAITELSTDELNSYGIEQAEHGTYYRVILLSSSGCGWNEAFLTNFLYSCGCGSGCCYTTWPSQDCPKP